MADIVVRMYGKDGKSLGVSYRFYPPVLDWMPIEVKAFWVRLMGEGHPDTKTVLLESQGEQLLVHDIALNEVDLVTYKEKSNGIEDRIEQYIRERGISRTPRNQ